MEITYTTIEGNQKIIQGISKYLVAKTQAKPKPQFAPVALPPKPAGQGGQNEYIFLDGKDLAFERLLNPNLLIQKWLWGHEHGGWIYWVDKKDAARIARENKKRKRRDRIPLHVGARLICWPAIALLNNYLYIDQVVGTKKGDYGHVVGIPADAALDLSMITSHPGWIHIVTNTKGQVIYRDGCPSYMGVYAREGRRVKAKGSLWIPMSYVELIAS